MRIGTLLKHYYGSMRFAVIIFISFYLGGTLLGSVLGGILSKRAGGEFTSNDGTNFSVSIFAFVIFMLVTALVNSQKEAKFLITRSVSRKEIWASNLIFMLPLAVLMAVLEIITIYIDGFVRSFFGQTFQGISLDLMSSAAPNNQNILVFFLVSTAILFCFGSIGYLLGSLIARWKIQTIGCVIILGLLFLAWMSLPDSFTAVTTAFEFMFNDRSTGLMIVLKQLLLGAVLMGLSFPVMRRMMASKQL